MTNFETYLNQSTYLSILTQVPADLIKPFVNDLLAELGDVTVLKNRTGLVMLPFTDTVKGTAFHIGEVLVAEAHVRLGQQDGYASVLGRDLQQALAVAILDAAIQADLKTDEILPFVQAEAGKQTAAEEALLKQVEATRVEMETF